MINPKTILGEWVTALQNVPDLVAALGGENPSARIQYYTENASVFGKQTQNNTRLAILAMPLGSILVAWQGTRPGRLGNMLVFVHDFSLYLRAPEAASVGYEDMFNLIVNGLPTGSTLQLLHTPIDAHCEPMDFYLPTAQRNSVLISADGATFEYFEVRVPLIESMNP
jgi:hypothetical protein